MESLPASLRAREARVDVLSRSITGLNLMTDDRQAASRGGSGSIRGIVRFMRPDLEWLSQSRPDFMMQILPVGCLEERMPVAFDTDMERVRNFDEVRRKLLHNAFNFRRCAAFYRSSFDNPHAEMEFVRQRAIFHAEVRSQSHLSPSAVCLPDLLAWYLLHMGLYMTRRPDEFWVVENAFRAARNLKQRAADFYNRCAVVKQARERLVLAYKLVERMRTLDRPCKRRDLVRGLNIQRMDLLGPVIDSLVGIGAFTESHGMLAMCPQASGKPLNENDFMEVHAVELDFAEYPLPAPDEERAGLRKNISPPKPPKPSKQLQR